MNGSPSKAPRASFDDHPCLSATAACSGLVPCEPCRVALATWVMPKALLAAECGSPEQVGTFLDTYAEARKVLVEKIRQAAVLHEEKVRTEAARQALVANAVPTELPPAPSPPPAKASVPAAKAAPQTVPLAKANGKTASKGKRSTPPPKLPPESDKTLSDLFSEAVSVPVSATSTTTPTHAKVKSP